MHMKNILGKLVANDRTHAVTIGDLIAKEHWDPSGFARTGLGLPLKQRGVSRLIVIGVIANICV